jgi:glutamate-1-semialdehyde aminotransferase
MKNYDHTNAKSLFSRAEDIILGGTQTLSKHPNRFTDGDFPIYAERAHGSRVWDIDGNEYLDFIMALGPVILGYGHEAVNRAAATELDRGFLTSLMSPLEVSLAEELVSIVPCAEMARFFLTGAEATQAAVRVARIFSGREKVISCGYHGWLDWVRAKNNEPGVPAVLREYVMDAPYGEVERLETLLRRHRGEIACLIMEPVAFDVCPDFLRAARELTSKEGVLLIFDEIITGFRLALGGAQSYFGVKPDLTTLGKAMANGVSISALVGRREVMESARNCWISSTYAGCTLGIGAALATIGALKQDGVYAHLWGLGTKLADGWRQMLNGSATPAAVAGIGPIPVLRFRRVADENVFMRHMLRNGVLFRRGNYWFISAAHTEEDIDRTLELSAAGFELLSKGSTTLATTAL